MSANEWGRTWEALFTGWEWNDTQMPDFRNYTQEADAIADVLVKPAPLKATAKK
jgi:hypothetical protein